VGLSISNLPWWEWKKSRRKPVDRGRARFMGNSSFLMGRARRVFPARRVFALHLAPLRRGLFFRQAQTAPAVEVIK
jgi:hypothetical protein